MNDADSTLNSQKLWENSIAECVLFTGWSILSLNRYLIASSLLITCFFMLECASQYLEKMYGVLYDNLEKKINDVFENVDKEKDN
jgi:hypothetical protein